MRENFGSPEVAIGSDTPMPFKQYQQPLDFGHSSSAIKISSMTQSKRHKLIEQRSK